MFKQQRDITPPTSDDEESQPKLVDYSDTKHSDDEDLTSYYTIKTVNEKKSRIFQAKGKEFQLNIKTFPDNVPHLQFIPRLFDWLVEDIKE